MKKNLFGLLAVVVAVGAVAFTTPKNTRFANVFFQYIPPSGTVYTEIAVENEANWVEVSDLTTGCNNFDRKACRIAVDDTKTSGTAPNRTINPSSTVAIEATLYAPDNTYFVDLTKSTDVLQKRNKQ